MYSAKELALARQIKPDIELAQLDAADLAVLQLVRKAIGGGSGVYNADIVNGIATFNGVIVSKPLVSLIHDLTAWQEGTGTPSPTNIRTIHGWDSISIANTSDYGSYFKGLLEGKYGFVDLGSLNWGKTDNNVFYSDVISDAVVLTSNYRIFNGICVSYSVNSQIIVITKTSDKIIGMGTDRRLYIYDLAKENSDTATFKTAMSGIYLIYELANQTTPTITEQQFNTLCTAFDIEGQFVTISIGSTVYGGSYDAKTGVLTVTNILEVYDGSEDENWVMQTTQSRGYYIGVNYLYKGGVTASWLDGKTPQSSAGLNENSCALTISLENFAIKPSSDLIGDLSAFKTYLSNHNLQVRFELAEPTTIQLSPAIINTIVGEQNNVFVSTGDVTECKYYKK